METDAAAKVTFILIEDLIALVKVAMVAEDQPADIGEMMGDMDFTEINERVSRIERRAGKVIKEWLKL